MASFTISGNFVDLFERTIYPAEVVVEEGRIVSVIETKTAPAQYILPGFIDAHVHIESSMLPPSSFGRMAVVHGTVATVSDPHEIANVCGVEGVRYMVNNSKLTPFKFFFGVPSCVPATIYETAGAAIGPEHVETLLNDPDMWYLSEMMNYPGVLNSDAEVMMKIAAARKLGKPVDGHAPGVRGALAARYAAAGITTDHESVSLEEAVDKVKQGMHCLIREGSAAKNFEALIEIIRHYPDKVMFCSDDKHPDELVLHHIDEHVRRAIAGGYDLFDVLRAASINPVLHYKLPVGLLREGDAADFIVVENLEEFKVNQTYINGHLVAENGESNLPDVMAELINNFIAGPVQSTDFIVPVSSASGTIRVIEALDGQLITNELQLEGKVTDGCYVADSSRDILKLVVVNRYTQKTKTSIAFIKNFGLKRGAIASSVAHDSHNIVAVGADDESLAAAINAVISAKGGVALAKDPATIDCLALPIAGLMSDEDGYIVAKRYSELDKKAKELGSTFRSPFMTLSFMALLVIPSLKLSDKGLFNGTEFRFTSVEVE